MQTPAALARSDARVVYVAAGRLAAAQWRAHLVREAMSAGVRAVAGTEVVPYRAFAANLWEARRGSVAPMLLSARQSRALWQRVITESPDGDRLLGTAGAARWAEDAWQAAATFGIDLESASLRGRGTDFGAFLGWARNYRTRLREAGWIDAALLDRALLDDTLAPIQRAAPAALVLADVEPTPAQRAVLARLEAAGTRVDVRMPPAVRGRAAVLRCTDPAAELEAAAEWAARSLAASPSACFALVVPDLRERGAAVRRVVGDALGSLAGNDATARLFVADDDGPGVDARPLLGALLNALELLWLPSAGFAALSRWLRSPFFQVDSNGPAAAIFERRLRDDPLSQVPFVEAYRYAGLRERMHTALPNAASRLDAALEMAAGPVRRSPAAWAALWPRALDALGGAGWPASRGTAAAEHALYEEALAELARLTPIVGSLTASEALAELEAGMSGDPPAALPLAGVHVVAELEDVGPGYAGAWVTGASDDRLPRPVELRPFLPRDVQVEAGMPCSSPQNALERSRALIERVRARVPEIVYSWPEHVRDEPAEPSPLLRGLAVHGASAGVHASSAGKRAAARRRETLLDPPPPLGGNAVRGGTAALDAQSICPLRAFCEHRLGARPLVPIERGLSPAARGRIVHRALERLFRALDSRAALERAGPQLVETTIRREARRAAAEIVGRGHALLGALADIEATRAAEVVSALVARELERAPFRVESLELERTIELCGRTLRVRIDRVDALESGRLAVIDYKTGAAPRPLDWLGERLRDVQLPVYAAALPSARVAGVVVAVVRLDRAAYAGFWEPADAFPGRVRANAELVLSRLIETWRPRLAALVDEYAAGDTRLFAADAEAAGGPYAPLTRVYELLEPVGAAIDLREDGDDRGEGG